MFSNLVKQMIMLSAVFSALCLTMNRLRIKKKQGVVEIMGYSCVERPIATSLKTYCLTSQIKMLPSKGEGSKNLETSF